MFRGAVSDALFEFNMTLPGGQTGKTAIDIGNAVTSLALYYTGLGQDYKAAIEKTANEVVLDRYSIQGVNGKAFRVPKSFDGERVQNGAEAALATLSRDLSQVRFDYDGRMGEQGKKWLAKRLAREGVWQTNSDESGLALFVGPSPIQDKNGKDIVLTWEQLAEADDTPIPLESEIYATSLAGKTNARFDR